MNETSDRATGIIVLARYDSRRLPGKALRDVAGAPLLGRVLERLGPLAAEYPIVVATSERDVDAPIIAFASRRAVPVFRGSADDVAARCHACASYYGFAAFVRITGDSPFVDPALIRELVSLREREAADLATNVIDRTFPSGSSVEVITTNAMARLLSCTDDPEDREHVTRYFYRCPAGFRIAALKVPDARYRGVNLAVDTPADLERAAWISARLMPSLDKASLAEIVSLARVWDAQHGVGS